MIELSFGNGVGLRVEERVLSSGLRVVCAPDPESEVCSCMLWVPAGPRTEPPSQTGISHFLEHCYSLGSRRLGPRELDRIVSSLGGAKNAFTSHDATAHYANLPRAALASFLEHEADRFLHLALEEGPVQRELQVVREERRLRIDNAPTGRLREALLETAYVRHPYRFPILGTEPDLEAMDPGRVRAYYRAHYVPRNAIYVVAGGVPPDEVFALFERFFVVGGDAPAPVVTPAVEPPQTQERRKVIHRASPCVPYIALLQKGPAFASPEAAALEVLSDVLLGGRTARLRRRLVRELKLATTVGGGFWGLKDPSPFTIVMRAQHGVAPETLERALLDVLEEVTVHGVQEAEVQEVRSRLAVSIIAGLEGMGGRARALGRFATLAPEGFRGLSTWFERVRAVTPAAVQRAAIELFAPSRRTVVWQLPTETVGRAQEIRGATRPTREHAPAPAAPAAICDPPLPRLDPAPSAGEALSRCGRSAYRIVLPGGLRLLLEPHGGLGALAITTAVAAGSAWDPPGHAGLAALTAAWLRTGTERRGEEALARAFGALGTGLGSGCTADLVHVSTYVQTRDAAQALALLAEVLRAPAFSPETFDRLRAEHLSRRKAARAEPAHLAGEALARRVYGVGTPYGRPAGGTLAGLEAASAAGATEHYAAHVRPERTILAIAGDLDPVRVADLCHAAFADWRPEGPTADARPGRPVTTPDQRSGRVTLVPKRDQTQTHVRLGQPLVPRSHPDWDVLCFLNAVLGASGLSARLPARVRTQEGLAYSAGSYLTGRRFAGAWTLSAQTKSASTGRALEILREEVSRIGREPVGAEELERVRQRLTGTLPFRRETAPKRAAALLQAELLDLGPDYLVRQADRFGEITAEELLDCARRHLDPQALACVAVGDPAAIEGQLAAAGPVDHLTEEDLDADG